MSDKNPPVDETEDERAARINRELFEDIEDAPAPEEETIDSLRAERETLRDTNARLTTSASNAQRDNLRLHTEITDLKAAATRAETKFEQDKKFALEKFVSEILPVIDTMDLALSNIPATDRANDAKFDKIAKGIENTKQSLMTVFNKFGIREINPVGEDFDVSKHEALGTKPVDGAESDTVVEVAQKGYEIEGRIIRPARVFVAA